MQLQKRIKSWLQLLRVPNFPTVPGDPLAGFALASLGQSDVCWWRVLPVAGCGLLLYAAGMIWNDCADYEEDLEHRPQRPLPSGNVDRKTAFVVGVVLAVAGVSLAATAGLWPFVVALVLLGLVVSYDWGRGGGGGEKLKVGKSESLKGSMGNDDDASISSIEHRTSNIEHSTSNGIPAPRAPHIMPEACEGGRPETNDQRPMTNDQSLISVFNMGACRGASFLLGASVALPPAEWSLIVIVAAVGIMLYVASVSWIAADELNGSFLSRYVGLMIRFLIVIQAMLCTFGGSGGVLAAGIILLGWPLSWWLSKRFYAS